MALFNWQEEQRRMFAQKQETETFAAEFASSPVAVRHAHERALREAQFQQRLENGSILKNAVEEIRQSSPTLPIEVIYREAGKRTGLFQ